MAKIMHNDVTEAISTFVASTRYESIPEDVLEVGKGHILDSLGCGLAGSISQSAIISRQFLESGGGAAGDCALIGASQRMAPRAAAFANALAMHADDFDDTGPQPSANRNGGIHATAPVLACVLALGEPRGLSGRAVMEALHIGVEISCKLNHAINAAHYARGFHSTATLGAFGSVGAATRILDLDPNQINSALGIAASLSSGLRGNFGSMMNPFHAGHASESGLISAELARRGFTSSPNLLDEPRIGYFQAMGGGLNLEALVGRLGKPWAFVDPGMWIKPFPCGALTHPALTALIDLARSENLKPEEVERVEVETNAHIVGTLIHNHPTSALQAKFSMPFAVAMALCRRRLSLVDFADSTLADKDVQRLIQNTVFKAYQERARLHKCHDFDRRLSARWSLFSLEGGLWKRQSAFAHDL